MIRFLSQNRWLIVCIGTSDEDISSIDRCIATVVKNLGLRSPIIGYESIDIKETRIIGATVSVEGEIEESFSEIVTTRVDKWKRKGGWKNVAILFTKKAFQNKEIFAKCVEHYAFDDSAYHAICALGDFLNVSLREECFNARVHAVSEMKNAMDTVVYYV